MHLILSFVIVMITIISDIAMQKLSILKRYIDVANKFKGIDTGGAVSVGLIGTSDGPTSVLVTSIQTREELIFSKLILFIILIVLYYPVKTGINILGQKRNDTRI